jgi:hypothetical protein
MSGRYSHGAKKPPARSPSDRTDSPRAPRATSAGTRGLCDCPTRLGPCLRAVATMPPDNGNAPPAAEAGGANQGDQQGSGSTGKATLAADVLVAVHTRGRVRFGLGRSRVELSPSPHDALELAGRLELAALHAEQAGAA